MTTIRMNPYAYSHTALKTRKNPSSEPGAVQFGISRRNAILLTTVGLLGGFAVGSQVDVSITPKGASTAPAQPTAIPVPPTTGATVVPPTATVAQATATPNKPVAASTPRPNPTARPTSPPLPCRQDNNWCITPTPRASQQIVTEPLEMPGESDGAKINLKVTPGADGSINFEKTGEDRNPFVLSAKKTAKGWEMTGKVTVPGHPINLNYRVEGDENNMTISGFKTPPMDNDHTELRLRKGPDGVIKGVGFTRTMSLDAEIRKTDDGFTMKLVRGVSHADFRDPDAVHKGPITHEITGTRNEHGYLIRGTRTKDPNPFELQVNLQPGMKLDTTTLLSLGLPLFMIDNLPYYITKQIYKGREHEDPMHPDNRKQQPATDPRKMV